MPSALSRPDESPPRRRPEWRYHFSTPVSSSARGRGAGCHRGQCTLVPCRLRLISSGDQPRDTGLNHLTPSMYPADSPASPRSVFACPPPGMPFIFFRAQNTAVPPAPDRRARRQHDLATANGSGSWFGNQPVAALRMAPACVTFGGTLRAAQLTLVRGRDRHADLDVCISSGAEGNTCMVRVAVQLLSSSLPSLAPIGLRVQSAPSGFFRLPNRSAQRMLARQRP